MSAKLIYTLTDEKAGLHKHISCMNGFFQIFDRHHFLIGRRAKGQKTVPSISGQSGNQGVEPKSASKQSTERSVKATKEKQRASTESSRTSFSSSCSSTFSSLECNRITQLESSSYGQNNFSKTPSRDFPMNHQRNLSVHSKPRPLDLQEFAKNSVKGKARALSIKTVAKEEARGHMFKHIDSPRPFPQPKSREEEKDRSRNLITREAPRLLTRDPPRFSFDGRESRDTFKSLKIKELPRLSLDSRERTIKATASEMKHNSFLHDLEMENRNYHETESYSRPSSVVAKLMGLEALPSDAETMKNQTRLIKTCPEREVESSSRSLDGNKQSGMLGSPRNSYRDSISPRMRNADSVTKSASVSKFPIEPAPWKQTNGRKGSQVLGVNHQEPGTKSLISSASVYGEIEKRLADIEFRKSGKDLRALKRILEAMQKSREVPETGKDIHASNLASQAVSYSNIQRSSKLSTNRNLQNSSPAIIRGNNSPRSSRSAIVIMKPATLTDRAYSTATLTTSTDSISDDQKFTDSRKGSAGRHRAKDLTHRSTPSRDPPSSSIHSIDVNTGTRTPRSVQASKVLVSQITGENATNPGNSSGSVSSRLQQKKNGTEKESCTTSLSPDSNRARRQLSTQPIESRSPARKLKPKSPNSQQGNNQLKKSGSSMRDLRNQGDAVSQQSESSISSASHIETDTASTSESDKSNTTSFQHYGQKQRNLELKFMVDRAVAEPSVVTLEQPSPISVLDATFYRDESPCSVKKITNPFKDYEAQNSNEAEWTSVGANHQLQATTPSLSSENDHKKSENIEHLVSISGVDESINSITVLFEHSNPDHIYISRILLASGLLRDLDSGMTTIPFHSSGNPINPKMFLAIEQTMATMGLPNDNHGSRNTPSKNAVEKIQRKLIFDVVNEILGHKLVLESFSKQWLPQNKRVGGKLKSQQLVTGLFSEIDQLQTNKTDCLSDDEDNSLPSISWGDVMHQSENWAYTSENEGLVLDIERLIFKDLISEVVNGLTSCLQIPSGGYCRQLFSK